MKKIKFFIMLILVLFIFTGCKSENEEIIKGTKENPYTVEEARSEIAKVTNGFSTNVIYVKGNVISVKEVSDTNITILIGAENSSIEVKNALFGENTIYYGDLVTVCGNMHIDGVTLQIAKGNDDCKIVTKETTDLSLSNIKSSIDNPLSVKDCYDYLTKIYPSNSNYSYYTDDSIYVKGIVDSVEYSDEHKSYIIILKDGDINIKLYGSYLRDDIENIFVKDEIIASGYGQKYVGKTSTNYELTYKKIDNIYYNGYVEKIVNRSAVEISCLSFENGSIYGLPTEALINDKIEFTVTPDNGFEIKYVKVNNKIIRSSSEDIIKDYEFIVSEKSTVEVCIVEYGKVYTYIGSFEEPQNCEHTYILIDNLIETTEKSEYYNTDELVYVKGIVRTCTFTEGKGYIITMSDTLEKTQIIKIYNGFSKVGDIHVGDTIIALGSLEKYKPTYASKADYEITYHEIYGSPSILSCNHILRNITVSSYENATVSEIKDKAYCGEEISFTVTPNEGYYVASVKAGNKDITPLDNTYKFIVTSDIEITINVLKDGEVLGCDHIIIYEVFGAGGNSSKTDGTGLFTYDYVVLYNPTNKDISLEGYSIQKASATGKFQEGSDNICYLKGSIKAKSYYLVKLGQGKNDIAELPYTPNASGYLNLSAKEFKIALCQTLNPISSKDDVAVVDFVGCGSTANEYETSQVTGLSKNYQSIRRKNLDDTDNNKEDFEVISNSNLSYLEGKLS